MLENFFYPFTTSRPEQLPTARLWHCENREIGENLPLIELIRFERIRIVELITKDIGARTHSFRLLLFPVKICGLSAILFRCP
jgi:hypothetical protein